MAVNVAVKRDPAGMHLWDGAAADAVMQPSTSRAPAYLMGWPRAGASFARKRTGRTGRAVPTASGHDGHTVESLSSATRTAGAAALFNDGSDVLGGVGAPASA